MIVKRLSLVFFFILSAIVFFWYSSSRKHLFLVSEVIDGDTIRLANGTVVRYIGLDTPELDECYGQQAKEINQKLVEGLKVRLETDINEMDRFGRTLAYIYVQDADKEIFLNEYLLREAAAIFHLDTVNQRYQSLLVKSAETAHAENKGLWNFCALDPKIGCIVKANYDKHGHRWYHLPDFRHYGQTNVNFENGDQWFCTEEEAIKAGFTRARE